MRKPRNIDDCIDRFMRGFEVNKISLYLKKIKEPVESFVGIFLRGNYLWSFEDGLKVEYSVQYGGYLLHESEKRQKLSIDNANKRLEISLRRIEELGLEIDRKEKIFYCESIKDVLHKSKQV